MSPIATFEANIYISLARREPMICGHMFFFCDEPYCWYIMQFFQILFANFLEATRIDNTPAGRLILHITLSLAEFEREMIKERTGVGKAIARQKPGYTEGRPKQITPEIIEQIKKGVPWEELGKSRATWYRYRRR